MTALLLLVGLAQAATTYTITDPGDANPPAAGTLRDVLLNQATAGDTIDFDLPAGSKTIQLVDELPPLDGITMVGAQDVKLDGSLAGAARGLVVQGSGTTVKGMLITGFELSGMHVTGTGAVIGSSAAGEPNIVFGNQRSGINIDFNTTTAPATQVIGNIVGETGSGAASGNCVAPGLAVCAGIWIRAHNTPRRRQPGGKHAGKPAEPTRDGHLRPERRQRRRARQ